MDRYVCIPGQALKGSAHCLFLYDDPISQALAFEGLLNKGYPGINKPVFRGFTSRRSQHCPRHW